MLRVKIYFYGYSVYMELCRRHHYKTHQKHGYCPLDDLDCLLLFRQLVHAYARRRDISRGVLTGMCAYFVDLISSHHHIHIHLVLGSESRSTVPRQARLRDERPNGPMLNSSLSTLTSTTMRREIQSCQRLPPVPPRYNSTSRAHMSCSANAAWPNKGNCLLPLRIRSFLTSEPEPPA